MDALRKISKTEFTLVILSPLIGFLVFFAFRNTHLDLPRTYWQKYPLDEFIADIIIGMHLVITLLRTHINQSIFQKFKFRFTLLPIALLILLFGSSQALALSFLILPWWDAYHSGLQTFGFARLYEVKAGNNPHHYRRLEWWFNHAIYFGPLLSGPSLLMLFEFNRFNQFNAKTYYQVFETVKSNNSFISNFFLALSFVIIAIYLCIQAKDFLKKKYRPSILKILLYLTTIPVNFYAWLTLPPLKAFMLTNFYHSLQYFYIVWSREEKSLLSLFDIDSSKIWRVLIFLSIFSLLGYLAYQRLTLQGFKTTQVFFVVISFLHFYYDGFIWSVREADLK